MLSISFLLLLFGCTVSAEPEEWLAIEFSSAATLRHNGTTYACIQLALRPEETNKDFEMQPTVQHPIGLPPGFEAAEEKCSKGGGAYTRVDRLREYVNNAVSTSEEDESCDSDESSVDNTPLYVSKKA